MADEHPLDVTGLVVTAEDLEALRQARTQTASWLMLSWEALSRLLPPGARSDRPVATVHWVPFSLD